jgi:ABC-type nitrate/sulfonate/bicarbonate transport system ATPase subunit
VERNTPWSVVGTSGAGKTTLLYLLAGLLLPDSGSIMIDDVPLQRPRPRTGLILQQLGLMPWSTVTGNAGLGLRIRRFYGPDGVHAPRNERVTGEIIRGRVPRWLDRLGLTEYRSRYPGQLSGGQRQRVAIARTMVLEPDLLLMDEPFAALDAPMRRGLQDLLVELEQETGHTRIIVTHDVEESVLLGRKILVLQGGGGQATVIDNPAACSPGYRAAAAFVEVCAQVRDLLRGAA